MKRKRDQRFKKKGKEGDGNGRKERSERKEEEERLGEGRREEGRGEEKDTRVLHPIAFLYWYLIHFVKLIK